MKGGLQEVRLEHDGKRPRTCRGLASSSDESMTTIRHLDYADFQIISCPCRVTVQQASLRGGAYVLPRRELGHASSRSLAVHTLG